MSVKVDIFVPDTYGIISSGYEKIKVYRSGRKDTDYSEATVESNRIALDYSTSRYSFYDVFGTEDLWYKWSYYSATGPIESSLSDPTKGTVSGTVFRGKTYPAEMDFTSSQQNMISRIRQYIGDFKEINRDYMSPTTSYENLSDDGFTITFDNPKAWPLAITVDGTVYTSIIDPIVNGYQFITFSGTLITQDSSTADVWYEHFRFSDREIFDMYETVELPPRVSSSMATLEIYELSTAINILESEFRGFMVTSSNKVSIYEEISIDASAGLSARQDDLNNLRKRLNDIIDNAVANNLTMFGVRIE